MAKYFPNGAFNTKNEDKDTTWESLDQEDPLRALVTTYHSLSELEVQEFIIGCQKLNDR